MFRIIIFVLFTGTSHIFEDALHEMLVEEHIEGSDCWVMDVVQLQMKTIEVSISILQRGNAIVVLCKTIIKHRNTMYIKVGLMLRSTLNS